MRIWAYVIAAVALVALVWAGCQHLVNVGVAKERAVWQAKYDKAQHDADIETARLQGAADAAEHAHDQELTDLRKYRTDHPLHGGLCKPAGVRAAQGSAADESHARASPASGDIQPMSEATTELGRQPEPDVRGMLDSLAGRCDKISAVVREYQTRQ